MGNMTLRVTSWSIVTVMWILSAGCSTPIYVNSDPAGARVIRDGVDTGVVTPAKFTVRSLPVGQHTITVEKDNCCTVTPPKTFRVNVSVGQIVLTALMPQIGAPINLVKNMWKDVTDIPRVRRKGLVMETFRLQDAATTNENATSAIPVTLEQHKDSEGAIVSRMRDLERLRKEGLISEEECKQKRQELLNAL